MNTAKCDSDVFEKGETIGVFSCTKEEAESICAYITKATNCPCDWHYAGGRVVMKIIPKIEVGLDDIGPLLFVVHKTDFGNTQRYENMFLAIRYYLFQHLGFNTKLIIEPQSKSDLFMFFILKR